MLKSKDICEIIKACSEAKVAELKFGDLHVLFAPADMGRANDGLREPIVQTQDEFAKQIERDSLFQDEIAAKEERLALMQIEDPAEYEKLLTSGELEDAQAAGHSGTEPSL
jgi:hypothetical protein